MKLADAFDLIIPPEAGVGFRAYDGSSSGRADAAVAIDVRTPRALEYIAASPGQLGIARAYVNGDLEIVGDTYEALHRLFPAITSGPQIGWTDKARLLRELVPRAFKRPEPPQIERNLSGRRHSKSRDADAISHHYDVSNRFYRWVLGPSMAYTCAVFPRPDSTLEQAQEAKFELVCRKLDLQPGMRLLDVGCGWGGFVRHAVTHHGVTALGVTLSAQQARWGQEAIAEEGLGDRAQILHCDYRDVSEDGFDAVASIGLTEHIGRKNYPAYFSFLFSKLRPQGRLLNHMITRPNDLLPSHFSTGFINRYVFPDGELSGPATIMRAMNTAGFELRHSENLREHYALTLREWSANLEANWEDAVAEAGMHTARVWRMYMAASRVGFELDNIQLHQLLGVKLGADGSSGFPLRPTY